MISLRLFLLSVLVVLGSLRGGAPGNATISCPASGNKQISTTRTSAQWIEFVNPAANSGSIYLGGSKIATSGANSGAFMTTGSSWLWPPIANTAPYDLSQIWFACGTSGDSLSYTYFQ